MGDWTLLPLWPGRWRFGWVLTGFDWSRGRWLLVEVIGEEVEGRVGQVGQTVSGGAWATAQWRTNLFGSRDSDSRPLPGQQGGQKRGLGWGAERGGDGERGSRRSGGGDAGCWRWFSPIPLFILFDILLSGSDGDGLQGCSMNNGWKMSSRARNRGMDWEE